MLELLLHLIVGVGGTIVAGGYIGICIYLKAFAPVRCSWGQAIMFFIPGAGLFLHINSPDFLFTTTEGDLSTALLIIALGILGIDYFRLIIAHRFEIRCVDILRYPLGTHRGRDRHQEREQDQH